MNFLENLFIDVFLNVYEIFEKISRKIDNKTVDIVKLDLRPTEVPLIRNLYLVL